VASWPALLDEYLIHDDARQHLFWVARLVHGELFPRDPIATYYQNEAPLGFTALWWLLERLLDTVPASKLVPLLLTALMSVFMYLLARRLTGRPLAAGLSAIVLTWSIWHFDDVASATPRAFATPLLVVFLYFLAARQPIGWLSALALQGLFYPLACAVMLCVLGLRWLVATCRAPRQALRSSEALGLLGALFLTALLVGIQVQRTSEYGPMVTREVARGLPEFRQGGRSSYFIDDPRKFWLEGRSGLLALHVRQPGLPELPIMLVPIIPAALLLEWAMLGWLRFIPRPDLRGMGLTVQLLLSSLTLYALAHLLLFRLYLPARHVQFSLPVVWALAGGLFVALLVERIGATGPRGRVVAATLGGLVVLALVADRPPVGTFYVPAQHPAVYDYLRSQPVRTLVAAQDPVASLIPVYAERSVLISSEFAIPYQRAYFDRLRDRGKDEDRAFYSDSLADVVSFVDRYGVADLVIRLGRVGPAMERASEQCAALRDRDVVVMRSDCVRQLAKVN
jgi:hypothetical protein